MELSQSWFTANVKVPNVEVISVEWLQLSFKDRIEAIICKSLVVALLFKTSGSQSFTIIIISMQGLQIYTWYKSTICLSLNLKLGFELETVEVNKFGGMDFTERKFVVNLRYFVIEIRRRHLRKIDSKLSSYFIYR